MKSEVMTFKVEPELKEAFKSVAQSILNQYKIDIYSMQN